MADNGTANVRVVNGVGLSGLVFVLFLGLKLIGIEPVANWSWWWVTSPLWIPWFLVLGCGVPIFIVALLLSLRK